MSIVLGIVIGSVSTALGYELWRIHRVHRDMGLPVRWMGPRRTRREVEATLALVRSGAMTYDAGMAQLHADVGTAVVLWRLANVPYRIEEAALEWAAEDLDRRAPDLIASMGLPPEVEVQIHNPYRARLEQVRAKIRRR